jgi:hypothetical protein
MQRLRDIERQQQVAEAAAGRPGTPIQSSTQAHAQAPRRAEAPPPVAALERIEATDRTGTIRVILGPDGLPESLSVEAGWRRVLGCERFATAVGEAAREALDARDLAGLQAMRQARPDGPIPRDDHRAPAVSRGTDPQRPRPAVVPTRPLVEVLAEAFDVMHDMTQRLTKAEPPSATGSAGIGRLVLTLTPDGALSCTADPHWVSDQEPAELTDALNRALASARAELDSAMAALTTPRLSDLAGELQAALHNVMRGY